jgi:hypothetical protein
MTKDNLHTMTLADRLKASIAGFSIFANETGERVSDATYTTAEEANHDYYMNQGHTHVGLVKLGSENSDA